MNSRFVLKNSGTQFTFQLEAAGNAEILLTSERYTRKLHALAGIAAVKACAGLEGRIRRRQSRGGECYFVLRSHSGKVVGTSQMYSSSSTREVGISAVRTHAPKARLEDLTQREALPSHSL